MSAEYEAALRKSRIATREYRSIQADYRARVIGDGEYLLGRALYEDACAAFDAAFAAEESRANTEDR